MEEQIIAWMASTSIAHFMGDWQWAWPWAETIHFIGMSLLFGSILVMDVRLIGFFRKEISLHAVHALTLWGLVGFLLNLVTGVAFVLKDAERYFSNPDFWFKMICILLAGVNFLVFWFVIRKQLEPLADDANVGISAKAVGFSSILLWFLVIWGGRLIPVYGVG
ncbi:MAG: DUF6644 family protein [Steroidobacteraceae bacterium]